MNSMLRQYQIRLQDLEGYLRGYDPAKSMPQDDWAKTESASFKPGMLVFCLDAVATPPGILLFGKKDSEPSEAFRVKDFCVVVSKENDRPLVVSITASAYELRFLEALMLEKARKAILDARRFYYVTAKPCQPLGGAALKELERLGNVYAQGGSRRSLTVEGSSATEPALALLAALGAPLSVPGGKQILDISSICHLLFTADRRTQEDKNGILIKSCFTPLANNLPSTVEADLSQGTTSEEFSTEAVDQSGIPQITEGRSSLLSEEQMTVNKDIHSELNENFSHSLFGNQPQPSLGLASAELQSANPPLAQAKPGLESEFESLSQSIVKPREANWQAVLGKEPDQGQAEAVGKATENPPPEIYEQLTEAILGSRQGGHPSQDDDKTLETGLTLSEKGFAGPDLPKEKSYTDLGTSRPQADQIMSGQSVSNEPMLNPERERPAGGAGQSLPASNQSSTTITGDHDPTMIAKGHVLTQSSTAEITADNIPNASETNKEVTASLMSTTPAAFKEQKAVMTEMASLMSKLEQQVSKASKKLASKAEEIEHRLNGRIEILLEEASQEDKNTEASILVLCDSLTKQFEQLSEELRLKISDAAALGRESIKSLQAVGQTKIEEAGTNKQENLLKACKDFAAETENIARLSEEQFNQVIREQMEEAKVLVETVLKHLKDIADDFEKRLHQRFERFTERMAEESSAVINSIQRNVHSMEEEIDGSWGRASEKLKSSQADFIQTIEHTLKATELSIAQAARIILVEQFLPKLKERKEIVLGMAAEMMTVFTEQSHSQIRSQLTGLDSSLESARQQLQSLAEECLSRFDSVGRQQQAGLEDLFKDTSGFMERSTADVLALIDKTEQQIHDVEGVCKKLAETSSLDADPQLTEERNNAVTKLQNLKGRLKAELDKALETNCAQLDELGKTVQAQLNARRLEQTQITREASENGLNRIKEAIQEAFNAVQKDREKYME